MNMPEALYRALELQLQDCSSVQMRNDAQTISERYRAPQSNRPKRLMTKEAEVIAYAAARMPATYGAVFSCLKYSFDVTGLTFNSLLDVGAGTGAASWAADSIFDLKNIVCLERENACHIIGKSIMQQGSSVLQNSQWIEFDIESDKPSQNAELVIASYLLNELPEAKLNSAIQTLWNSAEKMLLIVEPGTPACFTRLQKARELLLQMGGYMAAPCIHNNICIIQNSAYNCNWCHFTCRIPRNRLQKYLKSGEAPYEDEKFSYIAIVKSPINLTGHRVLRHPQIHGGFVTLNVCGADEIQNITLSKKNAASYKAARKAKSGDLLQPSHIT